MFYLDHFVSQCFAWLTFDQQLWMKGLAVMYNYFPVFLLKISAIVFYNVKYTVCLSWSSIDEHGDSLDRFEANASCPCKPTDG